MPSHSRLHGRVSNRLLNEFLYLGNDDLHCVTITGDDLQRDALMNKAQAVLDEMNTHAACSFRRHGSRSLLLDFRFVFRQAEEAITFKLKMA